MLTSQHGKQRVKSHEQSQIHNALQQLFSRNLPTVFTEPPLLPSIIIIILWFTHDSGCDLQSTHPYVQIHFSAFRKRCKHLLPGHT